MLPESEDRCVMVTAHILPTPPSKTKYGYSKAWVWPGFRYELRYPNAWMIVLVILGFIVILVSGLAFLPSRRCTNHWFENKGYCYRVFENLTYADATETCKVHYSSLTKTFHPMPVDKYWLDYCAIGNKIEWNITLFNFTYSNESERTCIVVTFGKMRNVKTQIRADAVCVRPWTQSFI
ncbi:hypothetical protein [Ranid herpesvirus 3]|uniref:C-type lectin protein n=1 Tax=Ranid herpesvirus 3 TaxID=1987509 RepID=A0A1X9T5H4_9VIRU|nr:hypothetical protein [Ranid herpesvirus 3]ARR28958.1 hypothetical protein [Ranid herpesvirus 3]